MVYANRIREAGDMRGKNTEGKQDTPESRAEEREKRTGTQNEAEVELRKRQEKSLDKTLADSFPTSDPPSSIPNPGEDENAA
jgi:hypothetical protein